MRMPAGRRSPDVGFDRESPGRARREGHLRDRARFELLLDVVAVKVHAQRLVRAPFKLHHVVLLDANERSRNIRAKQAPRAPGQVSVSVVEDAGRNLVEHPRKTDERDDGKNANPVRKAHGLHIASGCRSPRDARVSALCFPTN